MPSISGALGGAGAGASIGSFGGPIGTLVGAGVGGLIGLFTGGKSKFEKNLEGSWGPAKDNLLNWSGENMDMNRLFRQLGLDQSQGVDKYLRGVLSANDTQALNALLGPQREGVSKSYQQVLDNVSNFAPRGGGRSGAGMEYDFAKAGQQLNTVATARGQAVGQLNQVAGQNTNAALQFGQQATQQNATVMDSIAALITGQQKNRRDQGAANGQNAYALGQLLGPVLADMLKKGGSGGGGGGWTPVGPGE